MEILIVEDEIQIAEPLRKNFLEEGHHAMVANNGEEALKLVDKIQFDVIILDWKMPKMSGIEVCKRLREAENNTPIILLTALTQISNKVEALNSGADDYITKPFSFEELLARIKAVVRRYNLNSDTIEFDDLIINLPQREVDTIQGGKIELTDKEFELLKYLIKNSGDVVNKDQLRKEVWHLDFTPQTNICEVTIKNLRKKLEEQTGKKYIKTLYGEGYLIIAE
ncbi:MAG: response regulator transcription factor [Ignavibacteria bacterium]|nr:MAG: response regulator transcription factor [Ignavibacteria bacterium]